MAISKIPDEAALSQMKTPPVMNLQRKFPKVPMMTNGYQSYLTGILYLRKIVKF